MTNVGGPPVTFVTYVFANVLGLEHMKYCHEIYVQFPHTRTHAPRTQTYTDWLMRDGRTPDRRERTRTTAGMESAPARDTRMAKRAQM